MFEDKVFCLTVGVGVRVGFGVTVGFFVGEIVPEILTAGVSVGLGVSEISVVGDGDKVEESSLLSLLPKKYDPAPTPTIRRIPAKTIKTFFPELNSFTSVTFSWGVITCSSIGVIVRQIFFKVNSKTDLKIVGKFEFGIRYVRIIQSGGVL